MWSNEGYIAVGIDSRDISHSTDDAKVRDFVRLLTTPRSSLGYRIGQLWITEGPARSRPGQGVSGPASGLSPLLFPAVTVLIDGAGPGRYPRTPPQTKTISLQQGSFDGDRVGSRWGWGL